MPGQISEAVKSERLARLQDLLAKQQRAFNDAQVGAVLPVLVTGQGRKQGQAHGRSPYLQAVHFDDTRARPGDIVDVRIGAASLNSLAGAPTRALEVS
jgi:tRNA-2-methylthio-N6-dimethylallyladenosine synthase